jgi:hypothetical protein
VVSLDEMVWVMINSEAVEKGRSKKVIKKRLLNLAHNRQSGQKTSV